MKGITREEYIKRIPEPFSSSDIYSYNILEQLLLLNGNVEKLIALMTKDDTPANQAMNAEMQVVETGGSLGVSTVVEEEPKPKRTRKKKVVENDVQGD